MPSCLLCKASFEPFLDLGRQPIANGFLTPDQFAKEPFFRLTVGMCPSCKMVQLGELVAQEQMFHENYAFFSGTSTRMAAHFKVMAEAVTKEFLGGPDPFVVELGSNDGIMLQNFAAKKMRHLGVEPSANVAAAARAKGIDTVCRFFDAELAKEIVAERGQADAVLGANVMCHIPYLHSVIDGIRLLLKPKGVLVFEDPYLGDILEKTSYDQIYDEHAFYFCVTSLSRLFAQHKMEIIDVARQPVHGGSMRYTIAHTGARPVGQSVHAQLAEEQKLGLDRPEAFARFARNVAANRDDLVKLLRKLRADGKRVVGYGATSKSTTVTNYCGITGELVEFISDTTPIKQGKANPGTHIPVKPYKEFQARPPDYALLFAWNHANEILEKETEFTRRGGKWIVYVPRVEVRG